MPNQPDSLLILAAGFGTRMGPLTEKEPKPLVSLLGKPLIDHTLDLVHDAGITTIAANLHYQFEKLEKYLTPKGVAVSVELPDILETGGGLRQALPLLGNGPVFTLNPDAVWKGPNPLALLRAAWDPDKMDALLLTLPQENALGYTGKGDFLMDAEGRLARGPGNVYSGAQIVKTQALHSIPDTVFSLNKLWDILMDRGRAYGLIYPGQWCDVGTPKGLKQAEDMLGAARV
ncbi:MAG TPA: nucleotidyltransferase family protein [Aliiroseovarius sp.]|nr:nucleotidyltransferase family protein [Aliiroseovarius sp.]